MTLLALALLLLQSAAPAPSPHRTLRVGPGEEFPSAAAALRAAAPGDTVLLARGVHRGALTLDRPVVLVGEPGAVVDGAGEGTTITVAADSVSLRGLTLRGSGRSLDRDEAAVKLVRCTGCRIERLRIERPLHGIYLLESSDAVIRDNEIVGDETLAEARRGNGIHLFHSTGVELARNRIHGTRDGIYFSFSSGNRVEENRVTGVRYGLHYMYSDDNQFRRNDFRRNAAGAAIMFSSRILFEENVFAEHVGYRAYGILLQTAYGIRAERNRIEGNLVGLFLDMSEGNTFHANRIAGNGIGIDLIASAEGNRFTGNAIVGNRAAVRKPNGDARNEWAVDGRGNHWGDRSVFDLDGDGIGDRPYRASDPFAGQAALRTALEIFAGTPAAHALSWAERAFPVFDLPAVEDPAPLVAHPAAAPAPERTDRPRSAGAPAAALLLLPGALYAGARRRRRAAPVHPGGDR